MQCTSLVNAATGRSVHEIFGSPDDLKFRSSMTLFSQMPEASAVFGQALEQYFSGVADPQTLQLLKTR